MLRELVSTSALVDHLPQPGAWQPVPAATDRAFWTAVDEPTRDALLTWADRATTGPWPELPATLWLDYARTGNRVRFEDASFGRRKRLTAAVLAACLTDDDRWHEEALNGVWLLCEETTWCIPAHDISRTGSRGVVDLPDPANPTLDLFAAETGALLAWTHAVLADRLRDRAPLAVARLVDEVRRRILIPQRTIDTWSWFGRTSTHVNNWNPWINSNVLACSLLLDDKRDDMVLTAERAVEGLDVFVSGYPADGACDEGHNYWWRAGASLAECLELLRAATDGALDAFALPLVREIGRYPHRVHIGDGWYVNVADGSARLVPGTACEHVLYRYGMQTGDDDMVAHARSMRGDGPVVRPGTPLGRALLALADNDWRKEPLRPAPLVSDAWWPDTQLLVARQTAGNEAGLLVSVKGGNNGEDHNHNDVGTVLVAVDGHPVLVDAGVAEYTAQHFSPRRYEIWTLRSTHHNVPLLDGHEQAPGRDYAARSMEVALEPDVVRASLDLAGAYPAEAGCRSWRREVAFDRSGAGSIELAESWDFDHVPSDVRMHLMTSALPGQPSAGLVHVPGAAGSRGLAISYDPDVLDVVVEPVELEDRRLRSIWGERLWRMALVVRTQSASGSTRLVLAPGDAS